MVGGKLNRVMPDAVEVTDGTVSLRPTRDNDVPLIIAARDDAVLQVAGRARTTRARRRASSSMTMVIGWVDYDHDRDHDWLGLSEATPSLEHGSPLLIPTVAAVRPTPVPVA